MKLKKNRKKKNKMDIYDCIEMFLKNPWKAIEITSNNPIRTEKNVHTYLRKIMQKQQIVTSKTDHSIIIRKYNVIEDECIVTKEDGNKVLLRNILEQEQE